MIGYRKSRSKQSDGVYIRSSWENNETKERKKPTWTPLSRHVNPSSKSTCQTLWFSIPKSSLYPFINSHHMLTLSNSPLHFNLNLVYFVLVCNKKVYIHTVYRNGTWNVDDNPNTHNLYNTKKNH